MNDISKPFNYWTGSIEKKVTVDTGDVLLAWSGTPGTSFGAHIWNRGNAVLNQHIFRIDFKTEIDAEWFVFALESPAVLQQVKQLGPGAGLKHMVLKSIREIRQRQTFFTLVC